MNLVLYFCPFSLNRLTTVFLTDIAKNFRISWGSTSIPRNSTMSRLCPFSGTFVLLHGYFFKFSIMEG